MSLAIAQGNTDRLTTARLKALLNICPLQIMRATGGEILTPKPLEWNPRITGYEIRERVEHTPVQTRMAINVNRVLNILAIIFAVASAIATLMTISGFWLPVPGLASLAATLPFVPAVDLFALHVTAAFVFATMALIIACARSKLYQHLPSWRHAMLGVLWLTAATWIVCLLACLALH